MSQLAEFSPLNLYRMNICDSWIVLTHVEKAHWLLFCFTLSSMYLELDNLKTN